MTAGSRSSMPTRNRIGYCISRIVRRARNESGMAAVEFSLILPILVILWIGGVEVTEALSVDRRINNLSSSIGDLVARSKAVTVADLTAIFNLGPKAMYPACDIPGKPSCTSQGLAMRVTAVNMDGATPANGTVAWSAASGSVTKYLTSNTQMNTLVPATLRVANTQVIMSEVYYNYKPAIGYVLTGPSGKALSDRMYFVPRLVTKITCSDCP
jgi:Flp pilus assembly protein TadG